MRKRMLRPVSVKSAIARDVPNAQTYRGVLPFIATDIVRLTLVATLSDSGAGSGPALELR